MPPHTANSYSANNTLHCILSSTRTSCEAVGRRSGSRSSSALASACVCGVISSAHKSIDEWMVRVRRRPSGEDDDGDEHGVATAMGDMHS